MFIEHINSIRLLHSLLTFSNLYVARAAWEFDVVVHFGGFFGGGLSSIFDLLEYYS